MRVQHMVDAEGDWLTNVMYEKDGVPACARLPGRHSEQSAAVIIEAKRLRSSSAFVQYVQH